MFRTKQKNTRRLVLKPFIGNCNRTNLRYRLLYTWEETRFILQIKSIVRAIPCWQTHTMYTLFRTERSKTTPCPVAYLRIGLKRGYLPGRSRQVCDARPVWIIIIITIIITIIINWGKDVRHVRSSQNETVTPLQQNFPLSYFTDMDFFFFFFRKWGLSFLECVCASN